MGGWVADRACKSVNKSLMKSSSSSISVFGRWFFGAVGRSVSEPASRSATGTNCLLPRAMEIHSDRGKPICKPVIRSLFPRALCRFVPSKGQSHFSRSLSRCNDCRELIRLIRQVVNGDSVSPKEKSSMVISDLFGCLISLTPVSLCFPSII